jgi:hypothetical protein
MFKFLTLEELYGHDQESEGESEEEFDCYDCEDAGCSECCPDDYCAGCGEEREAFGNFCPHCGHEH